MDKIFGRVVKGEKYGRLLGFPTANLDRRSYVRNKLKIKLGVWAGWAQIVASGYHLAVRKWKAGIVIGPMDKQHLPKLEVHLINFRGNLYGKRLGVTLQKYIRPFRKFKSAQALKAQIKNDIIKIKRILS